MQREGCGKSLEGEKVEGECTGSSSQSECTYLYSSQMARAQIASPLTGLTSPSDDISGRTVRGLRTAVHQPASDTDELEPHMGQYSTF